MPGDSALSATGSILPLAAVVVPAIAAVAIHRLSDPVARDRVAIAGSVAAAGLVAAMLPGLLSGRVHTYDAGQIAPGIAFELAADPLGWGFAAFVALVYLVAVPVLVSQRRSGRPSAGGRVYACLLAGQSTAIGAALAGNLLLLFGFLELLTLVTYPLVARAGDRRARRAGYAYLAYGFGGGLAVLVGTRMVYAEGGTVAFVADGIPALVAAGEPWTLRVALTLFVVGFGVKAAVVPLHSWLVRARRTPPSVFGTVFVGVVTTAGVFGLVRVVLEIFGPTTAGSLGLVPLGLGIAAATAVYAGSLAIAVDRFRDRLVFLSVAWGGVALVGIAIPGAELVTAALVVTMAGAVCVLFGFFALGTLEGATTAAGRPDPRSRSVLRVVAVSLVAISVVAAVVGTWSVAAEGVPVAPAVAAILAVVALSHVLALLPVVRGIASTGPEPPAVPEPSRLPPVGIPVVDRGASRMRSMAMTVGDMGDRVARAALVGVRRPDRAIEHALPPRLRPRYREHLDRSIGTTGTKLDIEASLYVMGAALALALLVGLR